MCHPDSRGDVRLGLGRGKPRALTPPELPLSTNQDSFSSRLQAQILARGISQSELARRLSVSPQAVSRWITRPGVEPRAPTVHLVAAALGCDPSVLDPRLPVDTRRLRGDAFAGVPGLHVAYLATAIAALSKAREAIVRLSPAEAQEAAFGKGDSSRVDVVAEHSIVATLLAFDPRATVLSEERGAVIPDPAYATTLTWCLDPVDRSRALHAVLRDSSAETLGELFVSEEFPLRGAGASMGAVSAIVRGEVLFSCLLDYASGTLFVAFPGLVVSCPVSRARTADELALHGEPIGFSDDGAAEGVVTYVGDRDDPRHAARCRVFTELGLLKRDMPGRAFATPGGPGRVLYMCNDVAINGGDQARMVVACGERLGEFVHWMPFLSNSKVLTVYELWCREFVGDVLVAPPPGYSVIRGLGEAGVRVDVERLLRLPVPHHYRGGIAVARAGSADDAFLRALPNHRRVDARG